MLLILVSFFDGAENIVGKEENPGNQHFLLFQQPFLLFPKQISIFKPCLSWNLQMLWIRISLKCCCLTKNLPFPIGQILDSSKLKEFADGNFEFDDNGKKFSQRVENTVGKGEIARYEQFFPLPTVFSKDLYYRHIKPGLIWKRVNNILVKTN